MARRKRIIEDIEVIDIADRGHAIGRMPTGEIVIIMGEAVPGDVVDMVYTKKKKGLKHGFVSGYKSKSSHRVEPRCQHFGTCGGCKWQHLDYNQQATHKENAVKQAIKRLAKDDDSKVNPIKAARKIYNYRNKLEYSFSTKRWLTQEEVDSKEEFSQRPGLGFHISGAFDKVLNVDQCHLQDEFTNKIRNTYRALAIENDWSFYDIRNNHGLMRNIIVRNTTLGQWMLTFIFGANDEKAIKSVLEKMQASLPEITSWHYIINTKANSSFNDLPSHHVAGTTHIEEKLGEITYRISPKSFFQTNSYQAKTLYDVALAMADLQPTDTVYDLYTGTGSIALYMAHQCQKVVGIEVIAEAIEDAKINAEINNIDNATFLVGDVKDLLDPTFAERHGAPDIIMTDPPRAGMHEDVVTTLLKLAPKKIVYISCNPSTQARDIQLLKGKYVLDQVTPVDMFPHTSHIESVALLTLGA